jgi:hypothetical protein
MRPLTSLLGDVRSDYAGATRAFIDELARRGLEFLDRVPAGRRRQGGDPGRRGFDADLLGTVAAAGDGEPARAEPKTLRYRL